MGVGSKALGHEQIPRRETSYCDAMRLGVDQRHWAGLPDCWQERQGSMWSLMGMAYYLHVASLVFGVIWLSMGVASQRPSYLCLSAVWMTVQLEHLAR